MRKLFFFLFLSLAFFHTSFALTPLSRTSFIRYNDNQREVMYLQQILNSDPDTIVATDGIGSPGKENWFFGQKTVDALKRFQQKYNLEVTGKVDFKTLQALNAVASGQVSEYISQTQQAQDTTDKPKTTTNLNSDSNNNVGQENIFLGDQDANPYLSDTQSDQQQATSSKPAKQTTKTKTSTTEQQNNTAPSKTYLDSILERYTNMFSSPTTQTPSNSQQTEINQVQTGDKFSNSYTPATPYYNPATGVFSSNPTNTQQANPYLNPYANPYLSPYGQPASSNPLSSLLGGGGTGSGPNPSGSMFSNIMSGIQKSLGQNPSMNNSAPTPMKSADYQNTPGGPLPKKFQVLPDGWLAGPTTHFGSEWNGSRDATPGSNCSAAMNSSINICSPATCIASLPIAAQVYFWGTPEQKEMMKSLIGRSASAQVAALRWNYAKIKGSPIEIVNPTNKRCTVAPIWETGPGDTEGGAIDLTPCIKKVIGNNSNFISNFRPVPAGKRGCEGFNYIPSTVLVQ